MPNFDKNFKVFKFSPDILKKQQMLKTYNFFLNYKYAQIGPPKNGGHILSRSASEFFFRGRGGVFPLGLNMRFNGL